MSPENAKIIRIIVLCVVVLACIAVYGMVCLKILDSADESTFSTTDTYEFVNRQVLDSDSGARLYTIQDKETGVLYLISDNDGITPLYNADGTLKTSK